MSINFNDFKKTLDKERILDIFGDDKEIHFNLSSDGFQNYTNDIIVYITKMNINLLENYHNWILDNYDILPKQKK